MYLMITVISNTDKIKLMLKALNSVGAKKNVVIDAIGTNNIGGSDFTYQPVIESTLLSISQISQYRKVILSVISDGEMFLRATEEVKKVLGNDLKEANSGIMFTIPFSTLDMEK